MSNVHLDMVSEYFSDPDSVTTTQLRLNAGNAHGVYIADPSNDILRAVADATAATSTAAAGRASMPVALENDGNHKYAVDTYNEAVRIMSL
jgi:hypothetical protein